MDIFRHTVKIDVEKKKRAAPNNSLTRAAKAKAQEDYKALNKEV